MKPANIKVDPNGRVKVLDFGLAKLTEQPLALRIRGPIDTWIAPALAFEFPISLVDLPRNVDVAPDGRFLVLREENEEGSNRELVLVENWLSEVQ